MIKNIALFVLGFTTGAAVASVVLKKKNDEDIESVKAEYSKAYDSNETEESSEEYDTIYSDYAKIAKDYQGEPDSDDCNDSDTEEIYIIEPSEYGANPDYDLTGVTHYDDGVLVNEEGEVMDDEDIQTAFGDVDYVSNFGKYEDDEITIRNEVLKIDYQIVHLNEPYEE